MDASGFPLLDIDPALAWGLAALSALLFAGTLLAIPWLVARIPADYFALGRRTRPVFLADRPALRTTLRLFGNLLGFVLVVVGGLLLLLPGPGILTILGGLMIMNFPGKYRLERWLVSHRAVRGGINRLRERRGRPPLLFFDDAAPDEH